MSNSEKLELSNLPDSIQTALKKDIPEQLVSEELKKITLALTQNSSNKTKAARQLGISRMTLWRKMKAFNL
jgi:transcriptional regulator of acetoin/glycerol metabolism